MNCRKLITIVLCVLLCATLWGCEKEKKPIQTNPIETTKSGNSILPTIESTVPAADITPVYVSTFGDTAILATVPLDEWDGAEPDCDAKEISKGGNVLCGGDHERETPITKVLILEELVPRSTAGWFRNMVHLESIEGLDLVHMEYVTDMNHMFTACEKLTEIKESTWDVSGVKDMTGIFNGCIGLTELPDWYHE